MSCMWKMANQIEQQRSFSLSALATEVRKLSDEYAKLHDDYNCVLEFGDNISYNVSVGGIDFATMGEIGPIAKALIERLFEARKRLIERYTKEAELHHTELKKRTTELMKTEPELVKLKEIPGGEVSTAMDLIKSVDTLRSAINGYYKVKAEEEGGVEYFKSIGEVFFMAVKALSAGQPVPIEIFTDKTESLKEPLMKFSALFSAVKPSTREELVGRFNTMMKALVACATLYRFPVNIAAGQKPMYISRFISGVKLSPFLELYGMELGEFTFTP